MISAVIMPGAGGAIAQDTLDSLGFAAEVLVHDQEAFEAARTRLGPRVRQGGADAAACDWVLLIQSSEVAPAGFAEDIEALSGTLYNTALVRIGRGPAVCRLARCGVPLQGDAFDPVEPVCPALLLAGLSLAEVPS